MEEQRIYPIGERYLDYLSDESGLVGHADSISFPENEEEILEVLHTMRKNHTPVTIQGGKTGITGCAVPSCGHILNLSRMKRIHAFIKTGTGDYLLKVEPGVTLAELEMAISRLDAEEELFWPPDPTEASATVGGMASCNARGICSFLYGDTRKHIQGARILHSDGTVKDIQRGEKAIPFLDGQMDLLDLYLGGEGMFGVLTELTLKLQVKPAEKWGISFFFENREDAFAFADSLGKRELRSGGAGIAAMEYMDRATIQAVSDRKADTAKLKDLPGVDPDMTVMIYIEIHGQEEEAVEEIACAVMELAEECRSDPDKAWAVSGEAGIEKLRAFRYTAAEAVNWFVGQKKLVEPGIAKLGWDMDNEAEAFGSVVRRYETDIEKEELKACIFGHIAGNHLHVNILPRNLQEYRKGQRLFEKWAEGMAGKPDRANMEHGVGKLKKILFRLAASPDYIGEMRRLKQACDPAGMWNPGNMFDA